MTVKEEPNENPEPAVIVDALQEVEVDEMEGLTGPKGGFSTALCGCCELCCVKCLWWMECCCNCVVLGQIMQRLGLTWLAQKARTPEESQNTCQILVLIGVINVILGMILQAIVGQNWTGPIFAIYFLYCCLLYEKPLSKVVRDSSDVVQMLRGMARRFLLHLLVRFLQCDSNGEAHT